jgi:hypothetical protein
MVWRVEEMAWWESSLRAKVWENSRVLSHRASLMTRRLFTFSSSWFMASVSSLKAVSSSCCWEMTWKRFRRLPVKAFISRTKVSFRSAKRLEREYMASAALMWSPPSRSPSLALMSSARDVMSLMLL